MSEEKTRVVRAEGLRLKLDPDLLQRAEILAKRMGMPTATMAAYAFGQFVCQQENALGAQERLFSSIGQQVGQDVVDAIKKLVGYVEQSQIDAESEADGQLPEAH